MAENYLIVKGNFQGGWTSREENEWYHE